MRREVKTTRTSSKMRSTRASTLLAACMLIASAVSPVRAASDSAVSPDQARGARQICQTVIGVSPGEEAFAECVSDLQDTPSSHAEAGRLVHIVGDPTVGQSYYSVSNGTRFHREQLACVQLGVDPVAFTSCVMNLSATLQASDHAMD
jgi:hypothetical protein